MSDINRGNSTACTLSFPLSGRYFASDLSVLMIRWYSPPLIILYISYLFYITNILVYPYRTYGVPAGNSR